MKNKGTKMDKKKGFTLIEAMIATVIMSLALCALVYGLTKSGVLTETVRNQDTTLNAIQDKLEEIANSDLSQIMTNYNGQTFPVEIVNESGDTIQLLTAPAGLNAQDHPGEVTVSQVGTTNLYDVTVSVTWQQRGSRTITRKLTTTFLTQ